MTSALISSRATLIGGGECGGTMAPHASSVTSLARATDRRLAERNRLELIGQHVLRRAVQPNRLHHDHRIRVGNRRQQQAGRVGRGARHHDFDAWTGSSRPSRLSEWCSGVRTPPP